MGGGSMGKMAVAAASCLLAVALVAPGACDVPIPGMEVEMSQQEWTDMFTTMFAEMNSADMKEAVREAGVNDHVELLELESQVAQESEVPYAAKCFSTLVIMFAVVQFVIFLVDQSQGKREQMYEKIPPGKARSFAELLDKAFTPDNLTNAKASMSLVPVASVLMLYVMFRARDQNIFESDPGYATAQAGMMWVTFGLLLLALDALTVRLYSDVLGNISQIMGTLISFAGYAVLLWAIMAVKTEYHDVSIAAKCLSALGVLSVGCVLAIKAIQFFKWLDPLSALPPMGFEKLESLVDESKIEEIRSVASFSPMMITAFFYLHFHHLNSSLPSDTESYAMIVRVSDSTMFENIALVLRAVAIIPTYAAFVVVMFEGVAAGIDSAAARCLLYLLCTVAVLKLLVLAIMEGSKYLLDNLDDDNLEWATSRVEKLTKLFKDMMNAASLAEILCIIFAYLHFRAKILLGTAPADDLSNRGILVPLIYIASIGIFCHMGLMVVNFLVDSESMSTVTTVLTTIFVAASNVALFGCAMYII